MTSRWNIDNSHSGVHFTVRHMVVSKVRGSFDRFAGSVDFDEADPSRSKVSVRIDAASINTREEKRDGHLRSPDFFDVAQFPALTFESTKIEKLDGNQYRVTGDLSLHGVTRPVVLEAELNGTGTDPWGGKRIGFSAQGTINRKDFGLNWNQVLEAGGLLVGEKIEIALDVEAVAAQAEERAA